MIFTFKNLITILFELLKAKFFIAYRLRHVQIRTTLKRKEIDPTDLKKVQQSYYNKDMYSGI